jgi:hypothetical protein
MKYIYTRFLLLLLTFLMTLPSQAQNVLVYTEDFENGPGAFSLNNSLYGQIAVQTAGLSIMPTTA